MSDAHPNRFVDPSYEIPVVGDLSEAVHRAGADERVIVSEPGKPVVAVIPLIDLKLLLRLEDAELDRIDVAELAQIRASDEYHDRVTREPATAFVGA